MKRCLIVAAAVLVPAVYVASLWWERGLATYRSSMDSPDGCLRIDTFRPFWLLPSTLHDLPHPDGESQGYGFIWEYPTFDRLYERSSGKLLGESIVFDGAITDYGIDWGDPESVGERVVTTGRFPLATTSRCADAETLSRLKASHDRGEWENGRSYELDKGVWAGAKTYRLNDR